MSLPPIHPAIVHFPIALITLSVVAEFIGYFWRSEAARTVAWWALVGTVISVAFTVPAGYTDMWRASLTPETHELVHTHLKIGWILAGGFVVLAAWRWFIRSKADAVPGGGYLTVAAIVFALTMFQGWYGGEMAYAHGAGVSAAGQGVRAPERAKATLTAVAEAVRKLPLFGAEKGHHARGHQHSENPEPHSSSASQPPHHGSSSEPRPAEESPPAAPSQPSPTRQSPPGVSPGQR